MWVGRKQQQNRNKKFVSDRQRYHHQQDVEVVPSTGKGNENTSRNYERSRAKERYLLNQRDELFGFSNFPKDSSPKLGYLFNFVPCCAEVASDESLRGAERQAMELFFIQQNGSTFKALVFHEPYFYVLAEPTALKAIKLSFERRFAEYIESVHIVELEDLDLANHLSGLKRSVLKLSFRTVSDLMHVRRMILPIIERNKARHATSMSSLNAVSYVMSDFHEMAAGSEHQHRVTASSSNQTIAKNGDSDDILNSCFDIREYDVPYDQRVSIDLGINVGSWYTVSNGGRFEGGVQLVKESLVAKADLRVLAFDIECTKQPLKFPDAKDDQIFMISYMVDGEGFLIISRSVVSEDICDFDYTPKPEFPGHFKIFNEPDEKSLIQRFFQHCQEIKPNVYVTYNGDWFDWPFLDARAAHYGISMSKEIGISMQESKENLRAKSNNKTTKAATSSSALNVNEEGGEIDIAAEVAIAKGEYTGRFSVHMDCLYWVNRDSYLPAGSRGLKAVTKAKLGYDPVEVDPEEMVQLAHDQPTYMADYSVSDAVATYFLYEKFIHSFVFSLCTIIPMNADDVLRRGSGTLCETLLMVEARKRNILCPNKQVEAKQVYTKKGQLLETETYVGGHVECLESGVFRDDLPCEFKLNPDMLKTIKSNIDRDLAFALKENHLTKDQVSNYDEIREYLIDTLDQLEATPNREEFPAIYHLDVAAMYPNIILTNRLQPNAIVTESTCSSCIFNRPESNCKRPMDWEWRGEYYPASSSEVSAIIRQLEHEKIDGLAFHDLSQTKRDDAIRSRLKDYCQKTKRRVRDSHLEMRVATTCQRENPFYVDTVRSFRDRRYEYKSLTKKWEANVRAAKDDIERYDASVKVVLYESLQLAHKCILNSFYGYVMRRGARWHSMEMAGVVTHTGGNLIKQARVLVDCIGRPLELDTDGIWCVIPSSFPQNFTFKFDNEPGRKPVVVSYLCLLLNADVHNSFTNHQYQVLKDEKTLEYETRSENSIFFELDGPYKAMVLPASTEEGRLLKKRYAVFNKNRTLAELKGFELKRRGELKIVKIFQSQVFEKFLDGTTLQECYAAVAQIANLWLDVLVSRGARVTDDELIDLISENRSMSRTLAEYGDQKSTSISTAKRLAQFLGNDMVKEKGLACKLLIANKPVGAPTTDRAIPTAIFSAPAHVRNKFIRLWLKDNSIENFDVRNIIDWDYYTDRLGKVIQKIITIPAALQKIPNPVPLVPNPEWLSRKVREGLDSFKQVKIDRIFQVLTLEEVQAQNQQRQVAAQAQKHTLMDIEDMVPNVVLPNIEQVSNTNSTSLADYGPELSDASMFDIWLNDRQRWWREMRKNRKRLEAEKYGWAETRSDQPTTSKKRSSNGAINNTTALVGNNHKLQQKGLANFARDVQNSERFGYWQILEIRQDVDSQDLPIPGLYKVFSLTSNGTMLESKIRVPRKLVMNSSNRFEENVPLPRDIISRRRVQRELPHKQPALSVFELELNENDFLHNSTELSDFLNRPEILGTFEKQMPLESRIISELGCVARVDRLAAEERRKKNSRDPYEFRNLESLSTARYHYLEGEDCHYRRIFLTQSGTRDRQVVALYFVDDKSADFSKQVSYYQEQQRPNDSMENMLLPMSSRCIVWIVIQNVKGLLPNVRPKPGAFLNEFLGKEAVLNSRITESQTYVVSSAKDCWERVSAELGQYLVGGHGPTIVLAQCAIGKAALLSNVPSLRDFPVIPVTAAEQDNLYPTLQWQRYGVRQSVLRYLMHAQWWHDRTESARYSNIPVGHLGDDAPITMSDTFLTRMLQHNNSVLWASPSSLPDLGGFERETIEHMIIDQHDNPHVRKPGCYRTICVEFQIEHLAINAVLEADTLNDIEAGTGTGGSLALDEVVSASELTKRYFNPVGNENQMLFSTRVIDSMGSSGNECSGAFKILRLVLRNWYKDVQINRNVLADSLLTHFYRWLSSPESLMYDPALHKFVTQIMEKILAHVLGGMERLGAKVVYANFQRIIISTGKRDLDSAMMFCKNLVSTLKSEALFSIVHFNPTQSWTHLLFLDEANFGGLELTQTNFFSEAKAILEKGMEKLISEEEEEEKDDDDDEKEVFLEKDKEAQPTTTNIEEVEETVERRKDSISNDSTASIKSAEDDPAVVEEENDNDNEEEEPNHPTSPHRRLRKRDEKGQTRRKDHGRSMFENRRGLQMDEDESHEDEDDLDIEEEEEDLDDFIVDDSPEGVETRARKAAAKVVKDASQQRISLNWNICQHLPRSLHDYFEAVVANFIYEPFKYQNEWIKEHPHFTGHVRDQEFLIVEEKFVRDLVRVKFQNELMLLVPEIMANHSNPDEFPDLPGSYLDLKNPSLELIKAICAVIQLDPLVIEELLMMRRSLFRILQVSEFSPEAEFKNPSLILELPNVFCTACNYYCDLDLCRDARLRDADPGLDSTSILWSCAQCGESYDREVIEFRLVENLKQLSLRHQMEDMICVKCGRMKSDTLSEYCGCSGKWTLKHSPQKTIDAMQAYYSVAKYHEFYWLQETSAWLLQGSLKTSTRRQQRRQRLNHEADDSIEINVEEDDYVTDTNENNDDDDNDDNDEEA